MTVLFVLLLVAATSLNNIWAQALAILSAADGVLFAIACMVRIKSKHTALTGGLQLDVTGRICA